MGIEDGDGDGNGISVDRGTSHWCLLMLGKTWAPFSRSGYWTGLSGTLDTYIRCEFVSYRDTLFEYHAINTSLIGPLHKESTVNFA